MRIGSVRSGFRLCHRGRRHGMGIFPNDRRRCSFGLGGVFVKQIQKLGAGHLAQGGGGQGAGDGIVVNVNVQAVHQVVVRVGKELFHGGVAHLGRHVGRDKAGKAVVWLERLHVGQCGGGGGYRCWLGWVCGNWGCTNTKGSRRFF